MNDLYPVPLDRAELQAAKACVHDRIGVLRDLNIPECLPELGTLHLLDEKLSHALVGRSNATCACGREAPSGQCSACAESGGRAEAGRN